MISSTPNSYSRHIGSFSDPVNTHWESLWFFREPNLNLFIVPEGFKLLAPPIDKMSRLPLSCSELLRSSCKLVYGGLRCLWLSMNFFKSNWCQDFMLSWLEWQIYRFSSFWPFWPLFPLLIMKNKSWKNHRKVRKMRKKKSEEKRSDLTKNWSCTSRLSIGETLSISRPLIVTI